MKRTELIQIRATKDEVAKMRAKAESTGLTLSAWLRALGLKAAAAALLLVLALPARAYELDRWTWQDTAWEAGFVAFLAADYLQTRDIVWRNEHTVRDGRRYPYHNEGNWILGRRPTMQSITAYSLTCVALHAGVSAVLPGRWRRMWQVTSVGFEAGVVGHNVQVGLSFRF